MATEKDSDLFARVKNGVIVEYPVYRAFIKNRGDLVSNYTPVVQEEKPTLPKFYKYVETKKVMPGYVLVSYEAVPLTLQEMLRSLVKNTPQNVVSTANVVPRIEDIEADVIMRISVLAGDYAEEKMDAFAKTKGYKDMDRAIGYKDDPDPGFAAEGQRCNELRSLTWKNLNTYFNGILGGTTPVPTTVAEIQAVLPVYTWG